MEEVYYRVLGSHFFNDDTDDKVGVIITNIDGNVLVVKGAKTGKYSLPKGSRMRGETDWEAAEREAWEEAGVDITELIYLGECQLRYGKYFILKMEGPFSCSPHEENTLLACWLSTSALRKQKDQNNADLNTYLKQTQTIHYSV
jgi:8-oxo-dGTP pyrophosphatase MutT (NUDIX family)